MEDKYTEEKDNLILDQLLTFHHDKRNSLSIIRIGITTLIAQISILSFLIVTSGYYKWVEVVHLMIPFVILNLIVFGIAMYLIIRAITKIHRLDHQLNRYIESRRAHGSGVTTQD